MIVNLCLFFLQLLLNVREADETDQYRQRVVQLLDEFSVTGVNGIHVCMVFEVSKSGQIIEINVNRILS
jgi:hypothetical protein